MKFEYDEYMGRVRDEFKKGMRYGQACYNVLAEMYPNLAYSIKGTDKDPFYSDDVTTFFDWLFNRIS